MNKVLYRYLLRQLILYPVTFSRNKNFDQYDNDEGRAALHRARILRQFKELLIQIEQYQYQGELSEENQILITFVDRQLDITRTFFLDRFEWGIFKEEHRCRKIIEHNFPDF